MTRRRAVTVGSDSPSCSGDFGTTPRRWLDAQHTVRARELLETTDLPVEVVAERSGFGSVTALRAHLRAATGATPADYRRSLRR
ncbi:helix-turn-helix domain-containing protein [Nocardia brasiliensis]|uniref:helix-turn-helix domain-containing protein n=1 Tax=Nocardia brasiliensis TaxID=37326 RepID=UPI0011DD519E|nr:helix-turn-helix domain-containing protein [Nocardia brasiliensis]